MPGQWVPDVFRPDSKPMLCQASFWFFGRCLPPPQAATEKMRAARPINRIVWNKGGLLPDIRRAETG